MKHLVFIIMAVMALPLITSCGNDEPDSPPTPGTNEKPTRTVLVYMVARNNLSNYAYQDIDEMITAVSNEEFENSRLLIYLESNREKATLCEITPYGRKTFKVYDSDQMSVSRERLELVIEDTKDRAPADYYGLIFWGHGTGYVQDGIDENQIKPLSYGGESINGINYWMNTTTMAHALEGKGFDWLYFDCCFMSGVEVAYELRHATDYIVASATELPASGTRYDKILKHLMPAESNLDQAAFETFSYYNSLSGTMRTCTMSVIKTTAIDELAAVMQTVCSTSPELPDGYTPQAFQTDADHNRYNWSYYDFEHYATALAGNNDAYRTQIKNAVEQVVTSAYSTPMLWNQLPLTNHCGLSTLIIESDNDPNLDLFGYRELSWWNDVVKRRFN